MVPKGAVDAMRQEEGRYPEYLRVRQLCQVLNLPPSTAYRMIHAGQIKVIRLVVTPSNPKGVIRIPKSEVERLLGVSDINELGA